MTHVKARAWIKRLPERRGDPLDAGAKAVLQELWDRVDWERTTDSPARDCYPSRRRLAEDMGADVETIKKRLQVLASAGWIRRERDGWALAWGEPFPRVAESPGTVIPYPRGKESPTPWKVVPDPGEGSPHIPSQDQVQNQPHEQDRSSTPEPDTLDAVIAEHGDLLAECPRCERETRHVTLGADRVQCSACGRVGSHPDRRGRAFDPERIADALEQLERNGVRMLDDWPHESHSEDPSERDGHGVTAGKAARKPRASRKPPPAQGALGLGTAAPSDGEGAVVEALLAEHDRLRRAALGHHKDTVTALPRRGSKAWTSMFKGCRQALRERGEPWCRAMLAWVGARWLANASQLAYSTTSVWTGPSCAYAAKHMGGPARASPRRSASMLSAPPPGQAPEYTLDESDDRCLL